MNPEDIIKYKSLYLQTSWGYLNMLRKNVAFLISGAQVDTAIDACYLAAHSLKSQSALMEYNQIGEFSGILEEIFKATKDKTFSLNKATLDVILEGLDKVHQSLTQIAENGVEVDLEPENTNLKAVKSSIIQNK